MKSSQSGSMSDSCESRLKPCSLDRESIISKLYINLCNLIVESRIPGVNDRGYGEGIHCPPLLGPNTHCCDLTIPECQKHQKLIHRLLRSMKRNIFEIEVFTLPDCCNETKFAERVLKKEYVLLEQWSFNCFHGSKMQSSIDIPQLLRAVRSFLYFSQISAWFSATNGKSPSSIYYWVRSASEVSSAKFESEPELHTFPLCKIYEGLYGTIEVRYRTRTQYVPIIPCSKHPPQENPIIAVIDDSNLCQTICLGTHIVKQLHKTCDTSHEIPISEKTLTEPLSNVLSSNISQTTTKTICGDKPEPNIKSKGALKHSNCQVFTDNVCGLLTKLSQDVDNGKNIRMGIKHLPVKIDDNAYIRNSSQSISQNCNITAPLKKESRLQKLKRKSLNSCSSNKTLTLFDSLSFTPKILKKQCNSYPFINSKLSLSSSDSGNNQLSSHKKTEVIGSVYDDSNSFFQDNTKSQNCKVPHLSKQHNISNKISQGTDFKPNELTISSNKTDNFSQHHLVTLLEKKIITDSLPISSKIVVSKCEPLLLEESSVPKKTNETQQVTKSKHSKSNKCKYLCRNKSTKNTTIDNSHYLEKGDSSKTISNSNILCSTERNVGVKCCNLNSRLIKKQSRKRKLEMITDEASRIKSKSKLHQEKEILKGKCNASKEKINYEKESLENVALHCPDNKLCMQCHSDSTNMCCINSTVSCTETLTSCTVSHSRVRLFGKRKLEEENSQDHLSLKFKRLKNTLQKRKKPKTIISPSPAFCNFSENESSNEGQKLENSSFKRKSTSQTLHHVSKPICKTFEIRSEKMKDIESQKLQSYVDNFQQNSSQNSESDKEVMHISLPCSSEKINMKMGKGIKENTEFCTKHDLPSTIIQPTIQFSNKHLQENYTYPRASTKHICDFPPKQVELCKPYSSSSLYSNQNIYSIAFWNKPSGNTKYFSNHKLEFNKGRRLLLNFEESIITGCLEPVRRVDGFKVEIGASGSFCPDHLTLPAGVSFYELCNPHQSAVPYMAHVVLKPFEYYLPKKGAMQVTLFNPSETVVKMFVLNYDLSNMPPMCHTFIRQKTYYMPVGATERDPSAPKWLRYIIHLRFASTKTGRIYLYEDLKIVILNKSSDDAASDHIQEPRELCSFLSVPKNPAFSSL